MVRKLIRIVTVDTQNQEIAVDDDASTMSISESASEQTGLVWDEIYKLRVTLKPVIKSEDYFCLRASVMCHVMCERLVQN